jgi:hypothetical protein
MYTKFTKITKFTGKISKCKHRQFHIYVKGEIFMASVTLRISEEEKQILAEAAKKEDLSLS